MDRRIVAVCISLMMLLSLIIIVVDLAPSARGNVVYVGGAGPGNYTTIQEGINAANPGDTVFVYNGTYVENVVIDKTINLTGEDRNNTIIDGGGIGESVRIAANWTNMTGFTVTNSSSGFWDSGIKLQNVFFCRIFNNNVTANNKHGIFLWYSNENTILNNDVFFNSENNIYLWYSHGNNFTGNNVIGNQTYVNNHGIQLDHSTWNNITNNNMSFHNQYGIYLHSFSDNNGIINNTIAYNENGIYLQATWWNTVSSNIISNNDIGIQLYSRGCDLTTNEMIGDSIFVRGNALWHWNSHHIDTSNTVNGRPVYYYKNQTGLVVPSNAGEVILGNCTNITLENLELGNGSVGVNMGHCSYVNILNNSVFGNCYGMYIENSYGNDIIGKRFAFK